MSHKNGYLSTRNESFRFAIKWGEMCISYWKLFFSLKTFVQIRSIKNIKIKDRSFYRGDKYWCTFAKRIIFFTVFHAGKRVDWKQKLHIPPANLSGWKLPRKRVISTYRLSNWKVISMFFFYLQPNLVLENWELIHSVWPLDFWKWQDPYRKPTWSGTGSYLTLIGLVYMPAW